MTSDQHSDNDDGGDGAAGDFQGSHDDIPDRADGIESAPPVRALPFPLELIPKGQAAQSQPKIIQGCCKVM